MHFRKSVPLVLGFVALAVGAAALVHPQGLRGVLGLAPKGVANTPSAPVTGGASKPPGNALTELRKADSAYDRGDFAGSVTFYMTASALARDAAERSRAMRGLHRAVLSTALVRDAPAPDPSVGPAAAHFSKLRERAEAAGTAAEGAWLAALRFAAGAGLGEQLPSVARTCIDAAHVGGPVEKQLMDCLGKMGTTRDKTLRLAMIEKGFGGEVVRRSMASAGAPAVAYRDRDGDDDDGPSGIGGTSSGHAPYGDFSAATRKALARAVKLEEQGLEEFKLAGPDGTNRSEHRTAAYKFLREARDIYDAAMDEDGDSSELQQRHKRVRMALALISKERAIGE